MWNGAQLKGIGRAAVSALAALLVLTPVCGALCQSSHCDLLPSAAGGPCHEFRMVSGDSSRIVPSAPSCGGRELAAEARPEPAKQVLADHLAALLVLSPDHPKALETDASDFLRKPGPLFHGPALFSTVLRN